MKSNTPRWIIALSALLLISVHAETSVKPLRALLVIGGCCHDYAVQKNILEAGLEARLHIEVDVCYSPATNTKPVFECYSKDNWAEGYDVIIHDECAADIKDPVLMNRILEPHRKGLPGVNLHCAMHSFRVAEDFKKPQALGSDGGKWFEFLGIQSTGHGPKLPIEVSYLDPANPITKGFEKWITGNEELYNNVHIYEGAKILAKGLQKGTETVVVWTNEFGPNKTKVFSTTLGHFNETVADARYLDLIARGLLWSCGKLDAAGNPVAGYALEPK